MLDALTQKFEQVLKRLRGQGVLSCVRKRWARRSCGASRLATRS